MECEVGSGISDSCPHLDLEHFHLRGWLGPVREHVLSLFTCGLGAPGHICLGENRHRVTGLWAKGRLKKAARLESCWGAASGRGGTRGGAAEPMAHMPARTPRTDGWRGHNGHSWNLLGVSTQAPPARSQPAGPVMAPRWRGGGRLQSVKLQGGQCRLRVYHAEE